MLDMLGGMLILSCFNYQPIYKAGSLMKKANVLSRRIDNKVGVEDDNKNTMLLKPKYAQWRRGIY
jgi:hypothetical protein